MAEISREQFNFTDKFQDAIIACIIKRSEFRQYATLIKPSYFTSPIPTLTARCIFRHFKKHNHFPSRESLMQLVCEEAKRNGEDEGEAAAYVERVGKIKTHDWQYVHEKVVQFCKERALLAALKEGITHFKEGTEPGGGYIKLFEEALQIGVGLDDMGLLLNTDAAATVEKVTAKSYGITTGYPILDNVWRNGFKPGWLVVPLAPPKRYKTAFCINMALRQAMAGHDVVYYACEISQELAALRALQNLTGRTEEYIYDNPKKFMDELRKGVGKLKGKFLFKGFGSKTAKIGDMESHFNAAKTTLDIDPRVAYFDYAETVLASETGKISEHQQQASIYTDARAFAHRAGVTAVMPDRCNAETIGLKVPNMKSFQGAFQKAGIVDVAIGLCATEEEYLENIVRYFIFINRHGKQFAHFQGKVDPSLMDMSILRQIEYVPEEPSSGSYRGKGQGSRVPDVEEDEEAKVKKIRRQESKT